MGQCLEHTVCHVAVMYPQRDASSMHPQTLALSHMVMLKKVPDLTLRNVMSSGNEKKRAAVCGGDSNIKRVDIPQRQRRKKSPIRQTHLISHELEHALVISK